MVCPPWKETLFNFWWSLAYPLIAQLYFVIIWYSTYWEVYKTTILNIIWFNSSSSLSDHSPLRTNTARLYIFLCHHLRHLPPESFNLWFVNLSIQHPTIFVLVRFCHLFLFNFLFYTSFISLSLPSKHSRAIVWFNYWREWRRHSSTSRAKV